MTAIGGLHRETTAATLARSWVALYTRGAQADAKERRRLEVESDVWEHENDRLGEGVAPSIVALEILGRMVRGMPADLFWRLKLEGTGMQLKIPFERITGAALLALVVLIPIAVGIDGYDTSRDSWGDELARLGNLSDRAIGANLVFHALAGAGLLVAATAFYLALRERAPILATFAAFTIAAAAVLVFAASATYQGLNALANDYVAGRGSEGVLETSRAVAIVMAALGAAAGMMLALSVYSLALAAHRLKIVPRWLIAMPAASAALIPTAWVAGATTDQDWNWLLFMAGLALLLVWLITAGLTLVLGRRGGRRGAAPAASSPLPA